MDAQHGHYLRTGKRMVRTLALVAARIGAALTVGLLSLVLSTTTAGAAPRTPSADTAVATASAWDQCEVITTDSCEAGPVAALGGNVVINIANPWGWTNLCDYEVIDANNDKVVRSGTVVSALRSSIPGLYSSYVLRLFNCATGAWGYIEG
jgi:hypothetical protein